MAEKIASPLSERAIFIAQLSSSRLLAALYTASVLSCVHSHIHAAVRATTVAVRGEEGTCSSGEASLHLHFHSKTLKSAAMSGFKMLRRHA